MSQSPLFSAERRFVSPNTYDAFVATMDRLDLVIATESQALACHDHRGLADAAGQKRQGLLELERILRSLRGTIPSVDMTIRLARFREALDVNKAALKIELDAAEAVAAIITGAMCDLESDGTYSRAHGRAAAYDLS